MAFETIRRGREDLITFLQRAPDTVLDDAASQGFISENDYIAIDQLKDPKEKMRKLLVKVQMKGEQNCQQFLEGIRSLYPDLPANLWPPASTCCPTKCPNETQDNCCFGPVNTLEKNTSENQGDTVASLENRHEDTKGNKLVKKESGSKQLKKYDEKMLNFLTTLGLRSRKLTVAEILEINSKSFRTCPPQTLEELPWHFLRKLMALNGTARNTGLVLKAEEDSSEEMETEDELFPLKETDTGVSVNPLDVLCAILVSSDSFLRQEILLKMSMCQFALPLLLPPINSPKCTLLLWAMRDIVRKWRPHSLSKSRGFREESLVLISMPTISFVRLGNCQLSKSKLLNEVLSSPQHHHDFFVHRDIECGNVRREISNGLVEISWYFPGGRENSDLFPEPLAVMNLRGDIESHWLQFSFLTQVSSAIFVVADNISDKDYIMLSRLQRSTSKYYFILNNEEGKLKESLGVLNKLAPVLNVSKSQLLVKEKTQNTTEFVKKLRSAIRNIGDAKEKVANIEEMADIGRELGIQIDEEEEDCQNGILQATGIIEEIDTDTANYKKKMLKLQGDLWKSLARVEKEMCRMKRQGDTSTEDYKSQLREKRIALRSQQNQCDLTSGIIKFISGINNLCQVEKHYFLKFMKFRLDCVARTNLLTLREEYKEKCQSFQNDPEQLAQLDKSISAGSLGVEHFMRELGQFYEAECLMVKEGKIPKGRRQFANLPGVAADLMLEGFPMELIDGDASNIPLQWITDVLTELHVKLRGKSKMQVLTVLGVQSTGKSTLLNTMFGLQFAVSSGRCTRGAFMTLLRVAKDFKQELGCDFILVIDTEGLKAPELAKLEDSYEHDNELATLVIGLSDITIVNLAMENATEMKDILQIVVHAFLRMEQTGHRPNCQFVHQNVSDVSAHEQNMRDRKRLLEQLNEMTRAAARMEKQSKEVSFSDIMEYDPEKHNWYIPGLWHGVPPMAPVNMGYSESVSELKSNLFEFMKAHSPKRPSKDIPQFVAWIKSLWNAVKHENFIFSFRNSLVADAYNQLSVKYSEWEWNFQKEMHLWVCKVDTAIQNLSLKDLEAGALDKLKAEAYQKLHAGKQNMLQCLQNYFESGRENLHLIEKYREDFIRSVNFLQAQLESYSMNKCQESILIRKGQEKIDSLQAQYLKTMEGKVNNLLKECKGKDHELSPEELEAEFEKMWKETLEELPPSGLTHRHIHDEVLHQLWKDLECRGSLANQLLQNLFHMSRYGRTYFTMKDEYQEKTLGRKIVRMFTRKYLEEIEDAARSLIDVCSNYVKEKVGINGDYDETYCCELLRIINTRLQEKDFRKLHTSIYFEVDVKYCILMEAADAFQEMHDRFVNTNSPHQRLERLKPQYFSVFKDLYLEKDACQKRAKHFCDLCLKPALVDHLKKRLGVAVVDDLLSSGQSIKYGSRSFFQFTVQKDLLENENFNDYIEYINHYERFVKSWIQAQLLDHFQQREDLAKLEREILNSVIKKTKEILESSESQSMDLSQLVEYFCHKMSEELVLSKDSLKVTLINSDSKAESFSTEVQAYIPEVMEEILSEQFRMNVETIFSSLPFSPQDEIFKRVFGCGKVCPFCKVPCEAGGSHHQQHFASIHRPQGLGRYRYDGTEDLVCSICSSDVASNTQFKNIDTNFGWHPYKEYQQYYPDWLIQPDPSITASDYWKFVLQTFNQQFAKKYKARPARVPDDWKKITKVQALESIQESFNMK